MSEEALTAERIRALEDLLPEGERDGVARAAADLAEFLRRLWRANAVVNLVSRRTSVEELVTRHLLESLRGLELLPGPRTGRALRLLDIGSGGGLPALPILLVRRDIDGVLVESVSKKARFLVETGEALGLTVRVVGARFPDPSMSELAPFDLLTSRAVADAGRLLRQAEPWMAPRARALLWTTEPLFAGIARDVTGRRESGGQPRAARPAARGSASARFHKAVFHGDPDAESRGIAVIECST